MKKKIRPLKILFSVFLISALISCTAEMGTAYGPYSYMTEEEPTELPGADESSKKINNTRLGFPSWNRSMTQQEEYILERDCQVISYNNIKHTPNWVSWHLEYEDFAHGGRHDSFRADPLLPEEWLKVDENAYKSSGFNRGHMCPSGDRTADIDINRDTFYMTNMIPQTGSNNSGPWNEFECYIRDRVKNDDLEAYIVAGPAGVGTKDYGKLRTEIGPAETPVAVPAWTWKVVIFIPKGENDLERISTENADTLAIWMPNDFKMPSEDINEYTTTIDFIESHTGFDFFANLPNAVEDVLEAQQPYYIDYKSGY